MVSVGGFCVVAMGAEGGAREGGADADAAGGGPGAGGVGVGVGTDASGGAVADEFT